MKHKTEKLNKKQMEKNFKKGKEFNLFIKYVSGFFFKQ